MGPTAHRVRATPESWLWARTLFRCADSMVDMLHSREFTGLHPEFVFWMGSSNSSDGPRDEGRGWYSWETRPRVPNVSAFEPFCAAFSAAMVVTVTEYVPALGSNLFCDTVVFALLDECPNVLDDIAACTSCRNGRKTGMHWTMMVPVISAENLISLSVYQIFNIEAHDRRRGHIAGCLLCSRKNFECQGVLLTIS